MPDYIAVSPDGKAIVSSDGTKLKVWTEQNGSCQFLPDIPSITSLSIHPNSQTLFLGVENGYIYIFPNIENPSSEKFIFFGRHEEEINALLVLNEGKLLASSSDDGTIKLWDIDVGDQGYKKSDPIMNLRGHQAAVFNIIPGREKNLISGGLDGTIRFWDLDTIPSNLGIQEGVSRACDRLKQHPQGIEVQQICEEFWISFSIPGISGF